MDAMSKLTLEGIIEDSHNAAQVADLCVGDWFWLAGIYRFKANELSIVVAGLRSEVESWPHDLVRNDPTTFALLDPERREHSPLCRRCRAMAWIGEHKG